MTGRLTREMVNTDRHILHHYCVPGSMLAVSFLRKHMTSKWLNREGMIKLEVIMRKEPGEKDLVVWM